MRENKRWSEGVMGVVSLVPGRGTVQVSRIFTLFLNAMVRGGAERGGGGANAPGCNPDPTTTFN